MIGVLCVLIEFFHPTLLVGLLGALSLALSFYGSGSLPLNILGVVLVVLGIFMLVFESTVPSHGLLTVGGLASFIVGAVAFYGSPGPYLPSVAVAWPIIVDDDGGRGAVRPAPRPDAAADAPSGRSGGLGHGRHDRASSARRARSRRIFAAGTVFVGRRVVDGSDLGRTAALARGTQVRVVRQEGLTLIVEQRGVDVCRRDRQLVAAALWQR